MIIAVKLFYGANNLLRNYSYFEKDALVQRAPETRALRQSEEDVRARIAVGGRYNNLSDHREMQGFYQRGNWTSVFAQYTFILRDPTKVQPGLTECGVLTAVHCAKPLNRQLVYYHLWWSYCTRVARGQVNR